MKAYAALAALLLAGTWSMFTASAAPIDGTRQGVIAPTFYSAAGTGTQSYIRLFSGAGDIGALSTFNVTMVGVPSGAVYGSTFALKIPYMASVQYSIGQFLTLANAGPLTGGDTSYAVYLRNTDVEAGYQHVTYSAASALFENISNCASSIGERTVTLHNQAILTNVHTSKVAGGAYPSTIYIYNQSQQPANYTLNVFNGGNAGTGAAVSSTAGKLTCQYHPSNGAAANSILAVPMSAIEASPDCKLDSDEFYADVQVVNDAGPSNAIVTHLVHASQYSGEINLTDVCAVNKASLATSLFPFISAGAVNTTYALSGPSLQAASLSNLTQSASGGVVATFTPLTTPTATVLTTATGFTLTTPDGKVFTIATQTGASGFDGPSHYEATSTDGTRSVEVTLANARVAQVNYATFGYFAESDVATDTPVAVGVLTAGLPAGATAVPTAGAVTFTGDVTGLAATADNTVTIAGGTVSLVFNYQAKTVTGTISNLAVKAVQAKTTGGTSDIALSGTIVGNTFTGTATAGASPAGAVVNLAGATGTFTGTIDGPNAFEIVGNLPLSANGITVMAAFGARNN